MVNDRKFTAVSDWLLVIPAIALFAFVVAVPVFQGAGVAFTNWNGYSPDWDMVGLRNFRLVVTDPELVRPILNTFSFTVLTIVMVNVFGLGVALGVESQRKLAGVLKTIFVLPIVISLVLAALMWSYVFADVLPALIGIRGLLGNANTVMFGLAIIAVWRDTGLAMLVYIAGLKAIPSELYEAATVDGAGPVRRFFTITVPLLAPVFTICITLWLGWGLRVFDYPMAATGGGPGDASETLAMYVYNYTFPFGRAGYGQAAAILMFVMVFAISGTVAKILRKREVEL